MGVPRAAYRYPRRGERIAPRTLREFLREPIASPAQAKGDGAPRQLCDLDENTWDYFSPRVIGELAQQIVDRVAACHAQKVFQHRHFPRPQAGTRLEDLRLENRTRRCLSREGLDDNLEKLDGRTIGEILSIRAFGPRCLVDLLTALESPQHAAARTDSGVASITSRSEEVTAAALRLATLTEAEAVRHDDPRFAHWMHAVDPEARTALELAERLLARGDDPPDPAYVAEQVDELCKRIEALPRRTLEQELIDIFASTVYQRNREILIGYYGWKDGCRHTLTEIGAHFGITRERVRQVCTKLTKRLKAPSMIPAPAMDRALALLAARLPAAAARIEAELAAERLTAIGMSIESLTAAAKLLGRTVSFKTVKIEDGSASPKSSEEVFSTTEKHCHPERSEGSGVNVEEILRSAQDDNRYAQDDTLQTPRMIPRSPPTDGRLVIRPEQLDDVLATIDRAKKEVYFHGLATVGQIAAGISKPPAVSPAVGAASRELVRQTLMLMDGFCWLDEPSGWFHLRGVEKHGLPKAIDKVLAVAREVTASQLAAALGRNRRLWKELPPPEVLLAFCRQMPRVRVEGDRIFSDPPRDWRKALTGVEAKLVSVLLTHGPVMERGAMEDLCVADGMNRFSFHAFISWSPVITQHGHSLYGLLGTQVAPQRVEELRAQRRANRSNHRVLDRHGQTDDGRVWLSYRLSKAASTYAVITVPAALKEVVHGRFQLLGSHGRAVGHLATKDGRAWGLGGFLRQEGARIGDRIRLTLDLAQRTAVVSWEERGEGRGVAGDQ